MEPKADLTKRHFFMRLKSKNMGSENPWGYIRMPPPYRHVLVPPVFKQLRGGRWVVDRRKTLMKAVQKFNQLTKEQS